jgi:hypothetical protein
MLAWDRTMAAGAVLLVVLLLGGCAPPANVTVTGTILQGDKPIAVSSTGVVQVTLKPDVPEGTEFTTYVGRCDSSTGQFEVLDVPPGKYKIGVEQLDPTPQQDKLQGAHSVNNSKIIREIDGKSPLMIDLAKPGT